MAPIEAVAAVLSNKRTIWQRVVDEQMAIGHTVSIHVMMISGRKTSECQGRLLTVSSTNCANSCNGMSVCRVFRGGGG